jgi:hypothetical protein
VGQFSDGSDFERANVKFQKFTSNTKTQLKLD